MSHAWAARSLRNNMVKTISIIYANVKPMDQFMVKTQRNIEFMYQRRVMANVAANWRLNLRPLIGLARLGNTRDHEPGSVKCRLRKPLKSVSVAINKEENPHRNNQVDSNICTYRNLPLLPFALSQANLLCRAVSSTNLNFNSKATWRSRDLYTYPNLPSEFPVFHLGKNSNQNFILQDLTSTDEKEALRGSNCLQQVFFWTYFLWINSGVWPSGSWPSNLTAWRETGYLAKNTQMHSDRIFLWWLTLVLLCGSGIRTGDCQI